jgi:hypothetical protein
MLSLRVFVPAERAGATIEALKGVEGVLNLVNIPGAEVRHGETLITAAVEPESANEVIDRLRSLRIERPGAVMLMRHRRTEVMPVETGDIAYWDPSADAVVIEQVVTMLARTPASRSRTSSTW